MRRNPKNFSIFSHYTYFVPGVADMFILLVWLLAGVLLGNGVTILFRELMGAEFALEYGTAVAYPVMFIPAMMYASARNRKVCFYRNGIALDSSHFGVSGGALCAVFAALATMATAFCVDFLSTQMPPVPQWLKEALENLTEGNLLVAILCTSVFAPVFEEWLCRGVVLRGLLNSTKMAPWGAIVISALFFALIHLNPWQAVPAFALGCLFGFVYYKTGSLRLTMLMHCVNNFSAVVFTNIPSLKDVESWYDFLPAQQYWTIFAACILLLVLTVRAFCRIPLDSPRGNCDEVKSLFEK